MPIYNSNEEIIQLKNNLDKDTIEKAENILSNLSYIIEYDTSKLREIKEKGLSIKFDKGYYQLKLIQGIILTFKEKVNFYLLPEVYLNEVDKKILTLKNFFEKLSNINNFNGDTLEEKSNNLTSILNNRLKEYMDFLSSFISIFSNASFNWEERFNKFIQDTSNDIEATKQKLEQYEQWASDRHSIISNIVEETQKEKEDLLNEAKDALDKGKELASQFGAQAHASIFHTQAEEHKDASENWLYASGGSVLLIIIIILLSFVISKEIDLSNIQTLIQFSLTKLILLSTSYLVLYNCIKNYKSNRHNYIVNKHRANALNSFDVFVEAAGNDEQTKNAVLLQATESIFSHQSTGLSNKDSSDNPPNMKIMEVIKSATNPKN